MSYLEIKSKNLIEIEALTLMGGTTKKGDDTKTGIHGSGNKYALASMLRQGIGFKIFSGLNEIEIGTRPTNFRGKEYDIITINGADTSLTTLMGSEEWDGAFPALREIYSNAMDEDKDCTLRVVTNPQPEEGYTCYYIEMTPGVTEFYNNIDKYFSAGRKDVLHSDSYHGTIYTGGKLRIYRKGILAHSDDKVESLFDYNLLRVDVNESRVLKDHYFARYEVVKLVSSASNPDVINYFLANFRGDTYEGSFRSDWQYGVWNNAWLPYLQKLKLFPVELTMLAPKEQWQGKDLFPFDLLKSFKKSFPELIIEGLGDSNDMFLKSDPSEELQNKFLDALNILLSTDYKKRWRQPTVIFGTFGEENTMGQAKDGVIMLSNKLELEPVDTIAKILIEENEHNLSGYGDMTRSFQNHLFSLYFEQLKASK